MATPSAPRQLELPPAGVPVPWALERVDAAQLAARLAGPEGQAGSIIVVDARDEDFAGGNIVGARNVPTKGVWLQDEGPGGAVDKVVQDLSKYQTVVVTCGMSVQRGPHAANRFEEARARLAAAGDASLGLQRVVLLDGGYNAFKACPASAAHIEGAAPRDA